MTIEDVTLDDLQGKLDLSQIPFWLRALPLFLLALCALDALGLAAGRPGIAVLVLGSPSRTPEFGTLVIQVLIVHAVLLGAAVALRYKSPLAGAIRLQSRGDLRDAATWRHLIPRFGATDEPAAAAPRTWFVGLFLALALAGILAINPPSEALWLVPAVAAAWILVAAGVAWFAVFAFFARREDGALSLGAAGALSLLIMAAADGFPASMGTSVTALIVFAVTTCCFTFIVTSDPSRDRVLRLRTTAGAAGGLYPCEPHEGAGPVFLKLQLDETSPLLLFTADHGSKLFRPVPVDAGTEPIALHRERVWIWNLRRLKQVVPSEIELRDRHDYVAASARVTQLLGSTTLEAGGEISEEALMVAARRVLDDGFAEILETELVSAFHDYAETLAPELSDVEAKLAYAEIELAGLDQVHAVSSGADSPVARLHREWKQIATALNATLAKLKAGRSDALELNAEWQRLVAQRLTQSRGSERGLSADESLQVVALLALQVTLVRTELGPAATALKQQLVDLPKAITGRFDEQRGWRKDLILKLLSDPVTASQFADVFGKNPELLGVSAPQTADPQLPQSRQPGPPDPEKSDSGTPRNRN